MFQEKYINYRIGLFLFLSLYFIFFQHLDSFHIRNWDESMFAVNAYEMSHNANFIVPYYKNMPDLWNSKPPMQLWFQILFIKIIGFNELSIRLPSALAGAFSAILLFSFFKKRVSLTFALCVFFVFVSSKGISGFHASRTGDSDALLSFFMLCYCIEFYKWLIEGKSRSIFYFFVFLILSFLTKSVAALLFMPAAVFLILYFKRGVSLLKNKWFYLGFILFLITSIGYFLLRDYYNSGYINYILHNDLGRINTIIESHEEPFDFYLNRLFDDRFFWMILVIPGCIGMCMSSKTRNAFIYLVSFFICYFLIISYSKTKLEWYDLPLFPVLSVFSAFAVYQLILKFNPVNNNRYVLLIFIFILPVYFSSRSSYKSEINPGEKKLEALNEYAFRNAGNRSLNGSTFLINGYDRSIYFYKYELNDKGLDFDVTGSTDQLKVNTTVILADNALKKELLNKYDIAILDSVNSAWKVEIKALK